MGKYLKLGAVLLFALLSFALHGQSLFNGNDLGKWEVTNYGTQGNIYVEDGTIIFGVGDGLTGITYTDSVPNDNYEISLQAKKINGTDFFCGLTFPVKDNYATLIVGGWGGALVGISNIDGKDASENDYKVYRNFETGQWYRISVKVNNERIVASIDEEELISINFNDHQIDIRSDIVLSTPLGIAAWNTKAAIQEINLTPLKQTND